MTSNLLTGVALSLAFFLSGAAGAQTAAAPAPTSAAAFDAVAAAAAVEKLASELEANFVFPDTGKAYAAVLRSNLAQGRYRAVASPEALATQVTADLRAVYPDRHVRMMVTKPTERAPARGRRFRGEGGITKMGWIAPGVAYIAFSAFPGDEATLAKLRAFMAEHAEAKTLIVDARAHHGGGLEEMEVMFPYLFATRQKLVELETRVAADTAANGLVDEGPTIIREAGPDTVVRRAHFSAPGPATGLRTAKMFLLTSHETASSAEHLSLALKRTGRATLIGETTRGAGHFGTTLALGGGFAAFVPMGRTYDPDTGKDWEATGIAPDIAVPADQALDKALALAGIGQSGATALAGLK